MSASQTAPSTVEAPGRDLLREAAEWRLIGLLLERPREGWRESVAEVAAEVEDPLLVDAAGAALEEACEGMYHAVFGPVGGVSLREAGYTSTIQTGTVIADVKAFYEAFAYAPQTEDPPDHLAVQSGFLGFMRLKEAFARSEAEAGNVALTAEAAHDFLQSHLATCARPLAKALGEEAPLYMRLVAAALVARAGDVPQRAPSPLAAMMEGCELTCGLSEPEGPPEGWS